MHDSVKLAQRAVAQAIRDAIDQEQPNHGAQQRLARRVEVQESTVSRWYNLASSPKRDLWPAIEKALRALKRGDLEAVYAAAEQSPALDVQPAELAALLTDLRTAINEGRIRDSAVTQMVTAAEEATASLKEVLAEVTAVAKRIEKLESHVGLRASALAPDAEPRSQ